MFGLPSMLALDNIQWVRENSEKEYAECIQNLILKAPFGKRKFYIFSFIKRVDDLSGIKKMYHQPRLTKPDPVPGTTLLRVDPSDPEIATIIWTLPQEENFGMYKEGKIFGDRFVYDCVQTFLNDPKAFLQPEEGDASEEEIRDIYRSMRNKKTKEKKSPWPE